MFDEQLKRINVFVLTTVTVKLQAARPLASLASQYTVVLPIGNVLPEGGLAVTVGEAPHESLAVTLKNTAVGTEEVTTRLEGQLIDTTHVGGSMVTGKLQFVLFPHPSLAVTLTMVSPIPKELPLGGSATTVSGAQPPLAVTVKNTTAPLKLVAVAVRLDGQFKTMGEKLCGLTVTVKLQLVEPPQLSLAVTSTGVVPIGNVLPLGGLAVTNGGGLQPPVAVTVKNTTIPFELVAVTVRLEEQLRLIGGSTTVTVKLQLVLVPQGSLAVVSTVVVPIGKVLPLAGVALTNGGGLQPPLADAVKNTTAPFGPVAVTVRFDGQLRLIGGLTTVTVKLQLVLLPQVSLAVVNTVVVPTGNVLPLAGLALTNGGGLQPPLAVTVKNTVAPLPLLALTVRLDGQFSKIGG